MILKSAEAFELGFNASVCSYMDASNVWSKQDN